MTARFEVVPHFSLGPLRLGMSADEVVALMGAPNQDDRTPWLFGTGPLSVDFSDDVVTFIAGAANTGDTYVFDGLPLTGRVDDVIGLLAGAGHQVQAGHPKNRDDAGTRFLPALNLCLWSNLRNFVDEVSIFTDRHWDG